VSPCTRRGASVRRGFGRRLTREGVQGFRDEVNEVSTEQDPAAAFLPIRASRAFSCGSAGSSDGIDVWSHPHR